MTVGCAKYAQQAKEFVETGYRRYCDHFKLLGQGVDRVAVEGPDGVVYKVDHCIYAPMTDHTQTESELDLFDLLHKYSVPWAPEYAEYDGVVAMKKYDQPWHNPVYNEPDDLDWDLYDSWYATTKKTENRQRLHEIKSLVGDDHAGNLALDEDGNVVLIDGGCNWAVENKVRSLPSAQRK